MNPYTVKPFNVITLGKRESDNIRKKSWRYPGKFVENSTIKNRNP